MLKRRDLFWLAALPIYQTIGTIRHEGSHALMAMAQGAKVTEFIFLPQRREGWGFLWGYVRVDGDPNWLFSAAPYLCDLLTFLLFFSICMLARRLPRPVWLNLAILGALSPFINSCFNYVAAAWRPKNDVAKLLRVLPDPLVHLYFTLSLALYAFGIFALLSRSRMAKKQRLSRSASAS